MRTAICTDLHIGHKEEDTPKLYIVANFIDWCYTHDIDQIVMTESYEMLWSRGWWINDYIARDTAMMIIDAAKDMTVSEITGNHFLNYKPYLDRFKPIIFKDEIEVDNWHIEHGHRLDPLFYKQKPWYWFPKWIKKNPLSPWMIQLTKKETNYKEAVDDVRRAYKCLANTEGGPDQIIIGHTHAQEDAWNDLFGTRVINLAPLSSDKIFLTIEDNSVEFHILE